MAKKLIIPFHEKLHVLDTEFQTYGCRHTNPDICGSCYIENICAFTSSSGICKKPSIKWKKQYFLLKNMEVTNE